MVLIKTMPNKERVESVLGMISLIERRIALQNKTEFSPLVLIDYYEVINELMTALLLCDGFKTLSHKDLIEHIKSNYSEITQYEIGLIDKLRVLRNRVVYEGFKIHHDYLDKNKLTYIQIIKKLKSLVKKRL